MSKQSTEQFLSNSMYKISKIGINMKSEYSRGHRKLSEGTKYHKISKNDQIKLLNVSLFCLPVSKNKNVLRQDDKFDLPKKLKILARA